MNEQRFAPRALVTACAAALLGACGGGGGSGDQAADPPASTAQTISGKVIDGYLAGASVCLDINRNRACDSSEPSAASDEQGGFAIAYDGSPKGLHLLARVTPSTRDLSRPSGFRFPAEFTLSTILDGTQDQHITPLTTMVMAQMDAGMTHAQAVAAVRELLGSNADPAADYVAQGDAAVLAKAMEIVDKVTAFGMDGTVDAARIRHVLNAIVEKGDIAAVSQADIEAQAGKPVYTPVDAVMALAAPQYSFVDRVSRKAQQIVGNTLQDTYQGFRDDDDIVWETFPDDRRVSGIEPSAQFVMKPDGAWSRMLTPRDWRAPVPLTGIGQTLQGSDPMTGIGLTFDLRRVDLGGQPMARNDVSGTLFGPNESVHSMLYQGRFPEGTMGYVSIKSYAEDYVVLPLGLGATSGINGCLFPYVKGGQCPARAMGRGYGIEDHVQVPSEPGMMGLPPYDLGLPPYNPDHVYNDVALPNPLQSAQQLVGLTIVESMILSYGVRNMEIEILSDGKARMVNPTAYQWQVSAEPSNSTPKTPEVVDVTWQIHPRYPEVMVFEISDKALAVLGEDIPARRTHQPIFQGAKFVLAVRNGQLQSGLLLPAGYGHRTLQFADDLPRYLKLFYAN